MDIPFLLWVGWNLKDDSVCVQWRLFPRTLNVLGLAPPDKRWWLRTASPSLTSWETHLAFECFDRVPRTLLVTSGKTRF